MRSDGLIGPAVLIQEVSLGAVQYRIKFDRLAKQITIGSQTITVESPAGIPGTSGINTVFVDGVDSSEGPHIVRTLWVDPQISSPHTVGIIALIRRTPELREFVRCDLKVDNSQQQSVIDYLCKGL